MVNRTKRTNRARARFLEALRESANISEAVRAAGIGRRTAYEWRDDDPSFAAEWDQAVNEAVDDLERVAWERARGWRDDETGKYVYSDRMLEILLKAHRKSEYAEKQQVNLSGNLTHEHRELSDVELAHQIASIIAEGQEGEAGEAGALKEALMDALAGPSERGTTH